MTDKPTIGELLDRLGNCVVLLNNGDVSKLEAIGYFGELRQALTALKQELDKLQADVTELQIFIAGQDEHLLVVFKERDDWKWKYETLNNATLLQIRASATLQTERNDWCKQAGEFAGANEGLGIAVVELRAALAEHKRVLKRFITYKNGSPKPDGISSEGCDIDGFGSSSFDCRYCGETMKDYRRDGSGNTKKEYCDRPSCPAVQARKLLGAK